MNGKTSQVRFLNGFHEFQLRRVFMCFQAEPHSDWMFIPVWRSHCNFACNLPHRVAGLRGVF